MDLQKLTKALGNPGNLQELVDTLKYDATGDSPVEDGHPRFAQHVALLTWASDTWEYVDEAVDRAARSTNVHRDTNRVTRDVCFAVTSEIRKTVV